MAVCLPDHASAQIVASERGLVRQTIDGTVVEIDYSRPSVRGRDDLFGGLVPWGESWTHGANEATRLRLSRPVELEGVQVEAGAYSLWIEVNESPPWRLMLHPDTTLFHTAHPRIEEARYVIDLAPRVATSFTETLRFSFPVVGTSRATLRLDWGTTTVPVEVEVESSIALTVPAEEGRGLAGEWEFGTPDSDAGMPLVLRYEEASEQVLGEWTQGSEATPVILVRKAEGTYQLGFFIGDSLGSIIDIWFFEFFGVQDGRPTAFEVRDRSDALRFKGRRTGG